MGTRDMPTRERVAAFITSVVGGDHVRAIADYYHEDASMQENLQERFVYDSASSWTVVDMT
jgi:ribosomal silencing factor RsfS